MYRYARKTEPYSKYASKYTSTKTVIQARKMPPRKINIYLSSTFADMIPYRDAIVKAMDKDSFNTRVNVKYAETAVHEPIPVWKKVENEVKNCDYYFLLLGERYGSICEDKELNRTQISYTEHEFNIACEKKDAVIIFWKHPDLNEHMDTRIVDGQKITDSDKQEKLKKFKLAAEKKAYYAPSEVYFKTVDQLIIQVQDAVNVLLLKARQPELNHNYLPLFCNRSTQTTIFKFKRFSKGGFQSFIVRGEDADNGRDLIRRFCIRELFIPDYTPPTTDLTLINDVSDTNIKLLLREYAENATGNLYKGDSITGMLEDIAKNAEQQTVALTLNIYEKTLDKPQIEFLQVFIQTLFKESRAVAETNFYFFLNVTELPAKGVNALFQRFVTRSAEPASSAKIKKFIKDLPDCQDTKRLEKVSKNEIVKWMMDYLDKLKGEAELEFSANFSDFEKGRYSMNEVFGTLTKYVESNKNKRYGTNN